LLRVSAVCRAAIAAYFACSTQALGVQYQSNKHAGFRRVRQRIELANYSSAYGLSPTPVLDLLPLLFAGKEDKGTPRRAAGGTGNGSTAGRAGRRRSRRVLLITEHASWVQRMQETAPKRVLCRAATATAGGGALPQRPGAGLGRRRRHAGLAAAGDPRRGDGGHFRSGGPGDAK
jgi:hypothetical protein